MPPSSLLLLPDALAYPLHRHSVGGDVAALHAALANQEMQQLVNQPMRDGTTAVHCAAEAGYEGKGGGAQGCRDLLPFQNGKVVTLGFRCHEQDIDSVDNMTLSCHLTLG